MLNKIEETTDYLKKIIPEKVSAGIILGTGLGDLAKEIDIIKEIPYNEIPNFPISTVKGHKGTLLYGSLAGVKVLACKGRFHYYEGYTMEEVAFPIRVLYMLGVQNLLLSNAAGGTNPDYEIGDLMILKDHINLMPSNPLIGINNDKLGPRFVDMLEVYDQKMIEKAIEIAKNEQIKFHIGVYAALPGPTFETPAEYKFLRIIGADAVGMSTVPEVITAKHMGMRCFAVSVITDLGVEGKITNISHEEVIEAANLAEPKLTKIFSLLLPSV